MQYTNLNVFHFSDISSKQAYLHIRYLQLKNWFAAQNFFQKSSQQEWLPKRQSRTFKTARKTRLHLKKQAFIDVKSDLLIKLKILATEATLAKSKSLEWSKFHKSRY